MVRCPVCGRMLDRIEVCDRCGYDERKDYEVLPTLGEIHRGTLSVEGEIRQRNENAAASTKTDSLQEKLDAQQKEMEQLRAMIAQLAAGMAGAGKQEEKAADSVSEEEIRRRAERGVAAYESKNYERAVEDLAFAAEHGDARAQVTLGKCYSEGNGVQFHEIETVRWYQKAAEQSEPEAEYLLGEACFLGTLVPMDHRKAVEWYRRAAEHGSIDAMRALGIVHLAGSDVSLRYQDGIVWLKKAAELGDGLAQEKLGDCYQNGRGVEADPKEAELWYRKAAETYRVLAAKGDTAAEGRLAGCYLIGRGVPLNITEAKQLYQMAAQGGDSEAARKLYTIYVFGVDKNGRYVPSFEVDDSKNSYEGGIAPDYDQSVYWDEMSVKTFEDMVRYGDERMKGACTGGTPHPEGAVKWYRKAAERGYAAAQVKLGHCYEEGLGVGKNLETAVHWYEKAALRYQEMEELYTDISQAEVRRGFTRDAGRRCGLAAEAMFHLGVACVKGIGHAVDMNEAAKWTKRSLKWCRMGAEWDDGDALYRLGWYYQNGIAVEQDQEKAGELFERAASKGNALARAAYDEWKRR